MSALVSITLGQVRWGGEWTIPAGAPGVVIIAHGSGSYRHSPRNRRVGGCDEVVARWNVQALAKRRGEKELKLISNASHWFEALGRLEPMAWLGAAWLRQRLLESEMVTCYVLYLNRSPVAAHCPGRRR